MGYPQKAKSAAAATKEGHLARNGADPRGIVKKDGAGKHNWGREDAFDAAEQDVMGTSPVSQPKIQTMSAEQFQAMKNSQK
ncbi:hypothetical protein FBU59_007114 [Linderina macrospora]|uniref:Uncharacterized protein n=1 Tax=Linderina macrospora TaxID=4868 RepID=A0ACC1IXW9_9FUNG|nr:hypothetical protein FBU59_007114 [Linderina macrospora]